MSQKIKYLQAYKCFPGGTHQMTHYHSKPLHLGISPEQDCGRPVDIQYLEMSLEVKQY